MNLDAASVLVLLVGLRVFAPDAVALLRRLLGAGVRVGAAQLREAGRAGAPGRGCPPGARGRGEAQ